MYHILCASSIVGIAKTRTAIENLPFTFDNNFLQTLSISVTDHKITLETKKRVNKYHLVPPNARIWRQHIWGVEIVPRHKTRPDDFAITAGTREDNFSSCFTTRYLTLKPDIAAG